MVRPLRGHPEIHLCEECGFGYRDETTATRCEEYCRRHHSCSLEITAGAVHKPVDG